MTGGSTTIKLLTTSNAPVNFTTTVTYLKAGTFKKIKRALELKKTIYFSNYTVNGRECLPQPIEISSIGSVSSGVEYIGFYVKMPKLLTAISASGNPEEIHIIIEADDSTAVV